MADIDDFRRLTFDHGGAEHAGNLAGHLNGEAVFDDVDDLVDHQSHRTCAVREHQQRLRPFAFDIHICVHADERHQLAAVLHHVAAIRQFDLAGVDFLEPGDQRQRHRLGLGRAGAEHQQRRRLLAGLLDAILRRLDDHLRGNGRTDRLRDTVRIDDHDHRAIAEDGVAGEHRDVTQLGRHRLDDDFLGVKDAVDDDAESLAADLSDDDEAALDFPVGVGIGPQQPAQARQRQQLVAQPQHRRVLDALDAMIPALARAHQFDDRQLRNGEPLAARFHDQGGDDRQRQRDLDGEAQADAGDRLDVDGAADLIDIGAHHVHADAAAGNIGDRRRSRKAGREDEFVNLRFRHLLDIGFADQPLRHRLGLDARGVEAAAIVGDANDDVTAFVIGRQPDVALLGLAGGAALGRRLQTVIGRIAQHMRERVLDQVKHLTVQFGLGALQFQLDLLAEFVAQVAHDAREFLPCVADRLHARLHHAFLQLGGDIRQPLQRRLEFRIVVAAHDFEQLVAGQHQFRHHGHQLFERIDGHPDRLAAGFGDVVFLHGFLDRLGLAGLLRFGALERRRIDRRVAERALEFIERDFTGPQHARRLDGLLLGGGQSAFGDAFQIGDQVGIGAVRLALVALERFENFLDAVDGGENDRHGVVGGRQSVAEFPHHRFGGVRQGFQARQAAKSAGALDGVYEAENIIEDLGVIGILLEANELDVDDVETLVGLGHEFPEQVVHGSNAFIDGRQRPSAALRRERRQSVDEAFNFGCGNLNVCRAFRFR